MKNILLILSMLFVVQSKMIAQNEIDKAYIIERTNTAVLNEIGEKSAYSYSYLLKEAIINGILLEITNSKNEKGYLSGFDLIRNPIYDFDDNVSAAKSSNIDEIWAGGSTGLDLDGTGIEIGHWEASGLALITHQEMVGKITHAENEVVTSHATHTACTMLGSGISPNARGMASNATIVSRRSNNDEAEIANFGATGGLLSNHSYSTGNPNGSVPLYGLYTSNTQEWDNILYNAPYLTACKSAGNDRNDGVNVGDNGYDIIYTVSTCKNLLTIGAVNDVPVYNGPQSVTQSSFSSWGPTDDWRIKPDLVANGVSLYSADNGNDTDYGVKSGTSMSTPTVTGAIALLQQLYHNTNGVYMKAATVKALLLGTTDEAGANDGPDFQSGWGLMNAERAAEVISDHGILELSITDGNAYTTTFDVDGSSPVALCMAWTDPAGNPVLGNTDDQTPMLVNDLDVKITQNTTFYEPWLLSPNTSSDNFTDAAIKGDNFRDNVERIDISNLAAGNYTVTVSHKGSLVNGIQDFSIILKGAIGSLNIDDLEKLNPVSIYPNPAKNELRIKGSSISTLDKTRLIYNLIGKNCGDKVKINQQSNNTLIIDISQLTRGVYFIHTENSISKIIKE
ncbi:MAG: S8 family serine peptidase [Crocinitomicaceae bacterium]